MSQHTEFVPAFTKGEALRRGLKFYFTGEPCKYGHISVRDVTHSNRCLTCIRLTNKKAMQTYSKKPERKEANKVNSRNAYHRHADLHRARGRVKYYQKQLDKALDGLAAITYEVQQDAH